MLGGKQMECSMPYKIHLRNRATPKPVEIAGMLIETRIVPELPPLMTVETLDDAKRAMCSLMVSGARGDEFYAVGWDAPKIEQFEPNA
jgi:hypothetical protein